MTTTPDPVQADPSAPATAVGDERRLHPLSWLFVLLQQLKQFIVPLVVLVAFGARGDTDWVVTLAPLVAVVVLAAIAVWQYFTFRYRVGTDRLVVRSGLLERSVREIPFARIHNVALHQALLHRVFRVAEVRLESAGGDKPEAEMRVLALDEAMALERLIRHRGAVPAAQPGAEGATTPDAADGQLLLALPTSEVLRLGLISNRGMVVVAGAFALAWQVFPERTMRDTIRMAWREVFGYATHLGSDWWHTGFLAVSGLLAVLVLMRVLSMIIAVVQYHGFRLEAHGRRLTVERGLLTRLRTSASRRRLQAFTLREGVLHRLFRRRALDVDSAVGGQQEQQSQSRGLRELAPVATPDACDALVRDVLPGVAWPPAAWSGLHVSAAWRLAIPGTLVGVVAAGALGWHFGVWGLLALAWIPWSAFVARQHARRAGWAFDARLLCVRTGWWSRSWRFAELDKVQALELRQSPMDRRCGTASLWFDTAGATGMGPALRVPFVPVAAARELHAAMARAVAANRLRW